MRVLLCDEREQQRKHDEKVKKNEKEEKKFPPQKVTDGHLGEQQL